MITGYLIVLLNATGALPIGITLGVLLVCAHSGLTPAEVAKAAAQSARTLWGRITSDTPAPVREPITPDDHPLAPTLDDLADDAAADPICHAAATGAPFTLHDHPGLGCLSLVQHLQAHGRTYSQAIDQAAALLSVRPVALERIIGRAWQRPTTDTELTAAAPAPAAPVGWDVKDDGTLTYTPDQVLAHAFPAGTFDSSN